MKRQSRSFQRFILDGLLYLEAALCLTLARLALTLIPFRHIAPHLGQHMQESPEKTPYRRWVFRVAGGIHRTYLRLPWHSTCLVQAIAAMLMLQRRGLDSTLYLGVAREGDVDLAAHAWLRSGDVLVTGVDEQQQYKTISSFMKTGSASTPQESTQNE